MDGQTHVVVVAEKALKALPLSLRKTHSFRTVALLDLVEF